jgi:hypothetical protein
MDEKQVVDLMKSSKTKVEWEKNCDYVKAQCGGYPSFWFSAIVLSGVMAQTSAAFGMDAEITIVVAA